MNEVRPSQSSPANASSTEGRAVQYGRIGRQMPTAYASRASAASRWRAAREAAREVESAEWRNLGSDIASIARNVTGVSEEAMDDLTTRLGERLDDARLRLAEETAPLGRRLSRSFRACDEFAHARPWSVIGLAGLGGALLGFYLGSARRR